jgi:non-heme chloroperoxidase
VLPLTVVSENPNFRFAKVRLETGPRIHYAEWGNPDGEPVVLLHGWPDSWFSFSRVMPLLPDSVRAVALDQRGFGDSDKPLSGYSIPEMGADVVGFLDALGIESAALVGHSFGSFVARHAAITHSRRLKCLVLIGTGFSGSNAVTRELQVSLRDLPEPIPPAFARDFQASTIYHPVPPGFFERIVAESMKLPARLWRLAIDHLVAYDDTRQLARIQIPTLLVWGDKDALFPRAEQDQFVTALPTARLTLYEETGHCPNWERPERVARDLGSFVQGC